MGGLTTKVIRQSCWSIAEGRIESPVLDLDGVVSLEIEIKGDEIIEEVLLQESYSDGFGKPRQGKVHKWSEKRLWVNTFYKDKCRFIIEGIGLCYYRYSFVYYWLMSDDEMAEARKKRKHGRSDYCELPMDIELEGKE